MKKQILIEERKLKLFNRTLVFMLVLSLIVGMTNIFTLLSFFYKQNDVMAIFSASQYFSKEIWTEVRNSDELFSTYLFIGLALNGIIFVVGLLGFFCLPYRIFKLKKISRVEAMEEQTVINARKLKLYRCGSWFLLLFAILVHGISLFIVHLLMEPHVAPFLNVVSSLIDYPDILRPMFLSLSNSSSYLLTGIRANGIIGVVIVLTGFFMLYLESVKKEKMYE